MDYKQKYEKALEYMRKVYPTLKGADKEDAEHHFPELKEGEDEKIRKEIVSFLKEGIPYYCPNTVKRQYWARWLEKQGEQKPDEWSEEDERIYQCLINEQEDILNKVENNKIGHSEIISDLKEMYRERIDWLKALKQRMKGM